jgi:excisionase family DNA binding protein
MRFVVTGGNSAVHAGEESDHRSGIHSRTLPMLLTVHDAASLLRTTRRAIYAMIERGQLPGIVRIGRRVLLRSDDLLHWLDQKSAPSQRSER